MNMKLLDLEKTIEKGKLPEIAMVISAHKTIDVTVFL